jgi:hypothetical protein
VDLNLCGVPSGEPVALEAMVMDLHAPHYNYEVIKKLVQVSLDGTAYDREVASNLVVYLAKDGRVRWVPVVPPCPFCGFKYAGSHTGVYVCITQR